jgi:structural maintenance of chromosome 2
MLRTHFNKSQFVVVSLKDGMFNNANVLFKTKFVDGVSTVRRYAQGPASDLDSDGKENARKAAKGAKGKRAAKAGSKALASRA